MRAGEEVAHRPVRLQLAEPLLQRVAVLPQPPNPMNALAEDVDILRAAERRVASLEALLKEKESQLDTLRHDAEQLQVAEPHGHVIRFTRYPLAVT